MILFIPPIISKMILKIELYHRKVLLERLPSNTNNESHGLPWDINASNPQLSKLYDLFTDRFCMELKSQDICISQMPQFPKC